MLYLKYSLLLIGLYVYSGLGLTLLICPAVFRKYRLFLSPIVGYCYLTLAAWWCYRFDLPGTDMYAPALLVPPFFLLYYALVRRRKKGEEETSRLLSLELSAALAVGVVGFLMISAPLIKTTSELTSMSLGNNDIGNYSAVSRYFKSFARSDVTGYLGQDERNKWLADEAVSGAYVSTAIAGSLFALETYQVQNMNTHVFFLFSILVFYALAREIFKYNHYPALGITALYGLNPIIYFTAYQVFEAQMLATALALCLILINVKAINDCRSFRDYYAYVPLAVLLNWGVIITYPHMFPFVYVPIVVYLSLICFFAKSSKTSINWALFLVVSLIAALALAPSRAPSLVSYFFLMANVDAGFFVATLSPECWYGITFCRLDGLPKALPLRLVLSVPLILIFAFGFVSAYRKDKKVFLLAAAATLPILAGYLLLSFLDRQADFMGEHDLIGGYKSYKLLSFFLPLILLGLSVAFRDVELPPKTRAGSVLGVILIVLVGCSAVSAYAGVKLMTESHRTVGKSLYDLKRIESNSRVQSINIFDSDWWDVMWEANFLLRKKLYFRVGTYYPSSSLDGDWNLRAINSAAFRSDDNLLTIIGFEKDDDVETIPVNESYVLEKVGAHGLLTVQFGEGWYESEGDHRWTGRKSAPAILILKCAVGNRVVDLHLKYRPMDSRNSFSVYLNENKIGDCAGQDCVIKGQVLKYKNILEFKSSLPPVLPGTIIPGNDDQRTLSYAFSAIEIRAVKPAAAAFSASPAQK